MSNLPPCPFCGCEAVRMPDDIEKEIAVCSGCGAIVAMEVWQKRVVPKLRWICANCGDLQEVDCCDIDNGTGLLCSSCGKYSIVNLFRESEYSKICEVIDGIHRR